MATLLDVGLLESFSNIFVFLLVFGLLYAVFEKTKLFENKSIASLISFSVAILTLFIKDLAEIIKFTIPWFLIMIFLITFVLLASKFMGFDAFELSMGKDTTSWFIVIISILILLGGFSMVFGEKLLSATQTENTAEGFGGSVVQILFDPLLLGAILLLLIGSFTIRLMAGGGGTK